MRGTLDPAEHFRGCVLTRPAALVVMTPKLGMANDQHQIKIGGGAEIPVRMQCYAMAGVNIPQQVQVRIRKRGKSE